MALYDNNRIIDPRGPVTDADIDAVERLIGRTLPTSLRAHFLEANGGYLEKSLFPYGDDELAELHQFLSMKPGGKGDFESTFLHCKRDTPFLPDHLIPFAVDQGAEMFCMSDAPDQAGQIFFFYSEDADRPDKATRFLAPSLKDFIDAMVDTV